MRRRARTFEPVDQLPAHLATFTETDWPQRPSEWWPTDWPVTSWQRMCWHRARRQWRREAKGGRSNG